MKNKKKFGEKLEEKEKHESLQNPSIDISVE